MKLLIFSDVHGDQAALERLMDVEADYYFAAGDLVSWGRGLERCGEILKRRSGKVYVLPGNHESAEQIVSLAKEFGLHEFHEKTLEVEGYRIAGFGYSSPTPFRTPGEYSEKEIAQRLLRFAALKPLVLICHCPPYGTPLDRVREGVHAGSRSMREFVDRYQPEFLFCGHIHEAEGVTAQIGKTRGTNVGKRGYLFDFATLENV